MNIFTLYFKTSSAISYTLLDDRQPQRGTRRRMNSHCCPCVFLQPFQGHSQLSTCSDHGIWTFPNPWAQPAPPGKAENHFWSGRNRHPAYGSQRGLSACTHRWTAPTHPPTAAWEQHKPSSLPASTAACPVPASCPHRDPHRLCWPLAGWDGPHTAPTEAGSPGDGGAPLAPVQRHKQR